MDADCHKSTDNVSTVTADQTTTEEPERQLFMDMNNIFYNYGLPMVCMFGIVGNILNLTILTRRKLRRSFRTIEQAANMCLIALALSDLMFCLFAFPTTFLPSDHYSNKGFILYYGMYSTAVINIFIMTSTWLTVTMATERYIAICHPLNQTLFMTLRRTKLIIVIVYVLSISFNIPVFWRYQIKENVLCDNSTVYDLKIVPLGDSQTLENIYRVIWAIVGNFIPLVLLVGFNICICYKIHKSHQYRQKFNYDKTVKQDINFTLTITLIVIVVMFLILVAPSEIVLYIAQVSHTTNNPTYKTVEVVMNFMQSVNFSVNFILYCIISSYFRKTLRHLVCCGWYNNRRDSYKLSMADFSKVPLQGAGV